MKKFLTYFSVIAVTVVVTLLLSSALQPTAIASPIAPSITPAQPLVLAGMPDRHPHIDEGLEHLRAAKHEFETAEKDFGGHRVKAIEHTNAAIHEGEICLTMP